MSLVLHACQRSAFAVHYDLSRGLRSLISIRQTAPLLGISGSLFGILNSFRSYGTSKYAVISSISGNICESLIPTLLGIVVSVLALFFHNYLRDQLEILDIEMDNAVAFVLNSLKP